MPTRVSRDIPTGDAEALAEATAEIAAELGVAPADVQITVIGHPIYVDKQLVTGVISEPEG